MMVMGLISVLTFSSCEYLHNHGGTLSYSDSLAVAEIARETVEPTFATPNLAQSYQLQLQDQFQADSVFRQLSTEQIYNIVSVLNNRGIQPTVKQIVDEFTKNRSVYDNLPAEPQKEEDIPQAEPKIRSQDTIIDTTINGQRVHIIKNKQED